MSKIFYRYGTGLYVNITNRCPCNCVFCVRKETPGLGDAKTLWHDAEPTRAEIAREFFEQNIEGFSEIVFCGYGEPTARAECLLWTAMLVSDEGLPLRLNTNGLTRLINPGFDVKRLHIFPHISVSLNAPDSKTYKAICRPAFGERAFNEVLAFVRDVSQITSVGLSVVNVLDAVQLAACEDLAAGLGVSLRVRG